MLLFIIQNAVFPSICHVVPDYVGQQVALLLVRLWQCLNMSPLSQKFFTLISWATFEPQYRFRQSVPAAQKKTIWNAI
jgi:hypothetical protein